MTKELWIALLNFLAGVILLAMKILPVSPDLALWLTFAVGVINLALAIFFGVAGFKARAAKATK